MFPCALHDYLSCVYLIMILPQLCKFFRSAPTYQAELHYAWIDALDQIKVVNKEIKGECNLAFLDGFFWLVGFVLAG